MFTFLQSSVIGLTCNVYRYIVAISSICQCFEDIECTSNQLLTSFINFLYEWSLLWVSQIVLLFKISQSQFIYKYFSVVILQATSCFFFFFFSMKQSLCNKVILMYIYVSILGPRDLLIFVVTTSIFLCISNIVLYSLGNLAQQNFKICQQCFNNQSSKMICFD